MLHRRLVCGYETLPARSEAVIHLTVIDPMVRHLNRDHTVCSLVVQPGRAHDCDRSTTVATTWWAAEFRPSAQTAASEPEGNEEEEDSGSIRSAARLCGASS